MGVDDYFLFMSIKGRVGIVLLQVKVVPIDLHVHLLLLLLGI